jgi:hypothetical protein
MPKRERINVNTIFGNIEIIFSKCPIAREPLDIKMKNSYGDEKKSFNLEQIEDSIKDYIPSLFLKHSFGKKNYMEFF